MRACNAASRSIAGGHDRRGDQNRFDAAIRKRLGFAELGAADADRAGRELALGDVDALVSLRMRAQRDARQLRERRHLLDVAIERVEIDHERGRVQIGARSRPSNELLVQTNVIEHDSP